MKVYEVIHMVCIVSGDNLGLYSTKDLALCVAKQKAEENHYPQLSETEWGEKDEWGITQGVYIEEIEVNESLP